MSLLTATPQQSDGTGQLPTVTSTALHSPQLITAQYVHILLCIKFSHGVPRGWRVRAHRARTATNAGVKILHDALPQTDTLSASARR